MACNQQLKTLSRAFMSTDERIRHRANGLRPFSNSKCFCAFILC
jgi:hypothetical protein